MAKKKKRGEDQEITPLDNMIDHLGYLIRHAWTLKEQIIKDASTVVGPRFMVDPEPGTFDPSPVIYDSDCIEYWEDAQDMLRYTLIQILDILWMRGDAQALRRFEADNADHHDP